ncbi:MAG: hypothetical protein KDD53_12510, partial [Bdellovibrionales bacterium]|nr:hypothetical protein [Bdellovibrionales bacterium]
MRDLEGGTHKGIAGFSFLWRPRGFPSRLVAFLVVVLLSASVLHAAPQMPGWHREKPILNPDGKKGRASRVIS